MTDNNGSILRRFARVALFLIFLLFNAYMVLWGLNTIVQPINILAGGTTIGAWFASNFAFYIALSFLRP